MKRRLTLLAALSIAAIGTFGATQAQANVYCASSATPGTCTTNFTGSTTAVQAAVSAAKGNPGPDTVRVGTGNFTTPTANGDFELFSTGANNTLNIVGEGTQANSVLSVQNTDQQSIIFDAGDGSTMSNLSISIPGVGGGTALWIRNLQGGAPPVVSNVNISKAVISNNPAGITGVELQDGASLAGSSVDVSSTNFTTAVQSDGTVPNSVSNTVLVARRGVRQNTAGGTLTVSRSTIAAAQSGAENRDGLLNLDDSWIAMPLTAAFSTGVTTFGVTQFADTQIDGSTISGGANVRGTETQATTGSGADAHLLLDNTAISAGGDSIFAYAENSGNSVTVDAHYSAYDKTKVERFVSSIGPTTFNEQNTVDLSTTSPGFVNAAANDFHLTAGSPLVDAGQPIDPPAGALDRDGNPRACQGNGSGLLVRDIGAFEYRVSENDFCEQPVSLIFLDPASRNTDTTPTFNLDSNRFGATFTCSIDGGPFSACSDTYTTPVLSVGTHTLRVKATDQFGNLQLVPDEKSFTIVAATCANTPGLCPEETCKTDKSLCPKDRTKPVVKGLKAPKKTKAKKVKVKFRSNEAGSKFKCKLNKGKAKACKSPWKTPKLKKGVNTVTVVATDKAGNVSKPARVKIKRRK